MAGFVSATFCLTAQSLQVRHFAQAHGIHAKTDKVMRECWPLWAGILTGGTGFIQGGRKHLRDALYMPAVIAAQHNPDMKQFYERHINSGKPVIPKLYPEADYSCSHTPQNSIRTPKVPP